jgi:hypothetical protein
MADIPGIGQSPDSLASAGVYGTMQPPKQKPITTSTGAPLAPQSAVPMEDNLQQELHHNYSRLEDEIKQLRANAPQKPEIPKEDPLKAIGSVGAILGVFGSLMTRQPLISGLNALTAGMQSLKKNDFDEYALKMQEYDKYMQFVANTEKVQAESFKNILKQVNDNYNQGMKALELKLKTDYQQQSLALRSDAEKLRFADMQTRREEVLERYNQAENDRAYTQISNLALMIPDPQVRAQAVASVTEKLASVPGKATTTMVAAAFQPYLGSMSKGSNQSGPANTAWNEAAAKGSAEIEAMKTSGKYKPVNINGVTFSKDAVQQFAENPGGIPLTGEAANLQAALKAKAAPSAAAPKANIPAGTTPAKTEDSDVSVLTEEQYNKAPPGTQYRMPNDPTIRVKK